ncbi:MAG TPA: hypothetical protein VF396_21900 [Bradyrhizobium sp.]
MLDHDHALCVPIAPVSIMVSFTTHFDTHTAAVTISIAMHLAAVTITVVAITTDADAKLFGTRDGRSSDRNSRKGGNNKSKLFHLGSFQTGCSTHRKLPGNRNVPLRIRGFL